MKTNTSTFHYILIIKLMMLFTGASLLISCAKEGLRDQKYYYGVVRITSLALPDQPVLRIDLGPDSLGSISPGAYLDRNLETQNQKHIRVYLKETNKLIWDTLVPVLRNKLNEFKFAYSEQYGLKGFINIPAVAPDSAAIQIVNQLPTQMAANNIVLDAYYYDAFGETGTPRILKDITRNTLHPAQATFFSDGAPQTIKLKNRNTGEFIKDANGNEESHFVPMPGTLNIILLKAEDDGSGNYTFPWVFEIIYF